jgi:hypothetical protein
VLARKAYLAVTPGRRELREHRDITHASDAPRDRDRHRHDHHTPAELWERPRPRQRRLQRGRQPALVGQLPQQDAAAVPGQAGTVISNLQAVVPAVMLPGEERSSPGDCKVWLPRNLPGPGRSSPLNRLSRPRRSRTRQVHRRFNRYQERIRETPAHRHADSAAA